MADPRNTVSLVGIGYEAETFLLTVLQRPAAVQASGWL